MKTSVLRRQAEAAGASPADLDAADDSDDTKAALVMTGPLNCMLESCHHT